MPATCLEIAPNAIVSEALPLEAPDEFARHGVKVFEHMGEGEELVHEPFQRLMAKGKLTAYEYDDFWMAMDTFKDRQQLEEIYSLGRAPWQVWHGDVAPHAVESYA